MNNIQPTEASDYLLTVARRIAEVYTTLPAIRAIIVTGSAVEGLSDYYSDIDLIVYYDSLPSEEALADAANHNQGSGRKPLGPRTDSEAAEAYQVHGIECQVAHSTVKAWEEAMASVLEKLDVTSPLQKALSGLLECAPLYGEPLIRQWQTRIGNYPDSLAKAMVEHYLAFFPLWGLQDRLGSRDATVWVHEMLVQIAQNLLGVLAGLNHLYYTPFQFKRMHRFAQNLTISPPNLANRIDALFSAEPARAAAQTEPLVSETLALVEQHMPQIDTSQARARIGWRQKAWTIAKDA